MLLSDSNRQGGLEGKVLTQWLMDKAGREPRRCRQRQEGLVPRVQQPDTTVQEVAGVATLPACSSAWGWTLKVHFCWWRPFLALSGRDSRDTVSQPGKIWQRTEGPQPRQPHWSGGWPCRECLALGSQLASSLLHPRLGELPPWVNPLPGPQTQIQGSSGKETEHQSYQRWLSLGHPPQRGTQLDYTGDIARSHCETVPGGPC